MAISATNVTTAANTSGATLATGSISVAAGLTILVAVVDGSGTVGGSVADGAGNTYTQVTSKALNNALANGFAQIFVAKNITALTSQVITYTKQTSGVHASMSIISVSGGNTVSPIDSAVTASASGSSTTPSVTSGTPTRTGELLAAFVGFNGVGSFTEDSGNGWAIPFNAVNDGSGGASQSNIGGGNQVDATTATKTFAPTLGSSMVWAAIVVGILPVFTMPTTPGSYALTGVTPLLKFARRMPTTIGAYAWTLINPVPTHLRTLVAAVGSYSITGISPFFTHFVAPANKFAHRITKFVLQKLRTNPPTLGD